MKHYHILLTCCVLLSGCTAWEEEDLAGKWQASYISVGGEVLDIDYTSVNFEFTPNGSYHFNSTVDYREAGTYYLDGHLLFTLDTLNAASTEKAVEILNLTRDSLFLKMMANDKDKLIKLYRIE